MLQEFPTTLKIWDVRGLAINHAFCDENKEKPKKSKTNQKSINLIQIKVKLKANLPTTNNLFENLEKNRL